MGQFTKYFKTEFQNQSAIVITKYRIQSGHPKNVLFCQAQAQHKSNSGQAQNSLDLELTLDLVH